MIDTKELRGRNLLYSDTYFSKCRFLGSTVEEAARSTQFMLNEQSDTIKNQQSELDALRSRVADIESKNLDLLEVCGSLRKEKEDIESQLQYNVDKRLAIQDELASLQQQLAEARADCKFLLSFVPQWAKDVPDGLCPTMYGTLTAEGDRQIKARVDAILAAIEAAKGE